MNTRCKYSHECETAFSLSYTFWCIYRPVHLAFSFQVASYAITDSSCCYISYHSTFYICLWHQWKHVQQIVCQTDSRKLKLKCTLCQSPESSSCTDHRILISLVWTDNSTYPAVLLNPPNMAKNWRVIFIFLSVCSVCLCSVYASSCPCDLIQINVCTYLVVFAKNGWMPNSGVSGEIRYIPIKHIFIITNSHH